jgi:uncharacterized protein YcfJ
MNASSTWLLAVLLAGTSAAMAQQLPAAYPSNGQSSSTQDSDKTSCSSWAQQQTGINPAVASQLPAQQTGPAVGGGQRVAGAMRGAAAGAVVGDVANDNAGHGAAVGAAAGVVAGGMRARHAQAAQNQAAVNQKAASMSTFNQAYGSCMKGRGYAVN